MKTFLPNFLLILWGLLLMGCSKSDIVQSSSIDFYLLKKYSTLNQSCQIDDKSVLTEKTPLIAYNDILMYDATNFTFQLSGYASQTIKNLKHSVLGLPFALKIDDEVLYTGYFWPSYSSASCQWIIIDPYLPEENQMVIKLGYPGLFEGALIPDHRNDEKLISVLRKDNKLKL